MTAAPPPCALDLETLLDSTARGALHLHDDNAEAQHCELAHVTRSSLGEDHAAPALPSNRQPRTPSLSSPTVDAFAKVNAVLARIQRVSHDAAAMSAAHVAAYAEAPSEQQNADQHMCDNAAASPPGVVLGPSPRPPGGLDGSVTTPYSSLARDVHVRGDRPAASGHEPEHVAVSSALLPVGRRGSLPLHPTRRLTAVSESAAMYDRHGLSHGGRHGDADDEGATAAEYPESTGIPAWPL